ncbi:MAG: IS5/IS1182 family transposase, partial [Sulfurimicrobium sp.]|nr:IS5/IS1182 family transposase [Sulfurimicrobium sp.]
MRWFSDEQLGLFSYVAVEDRIPADLPLRTIRKLVDKALVQI